MAGVLSIKIDTLDKLSDRDFRFLSQLVYDMTGIVLGESKRNMVCRRLMRRKRALQINSYQEYCDILKHDNTQELPNLINAITTNLTSFFREKHHFDYLAQFLREQTCIGSNDRRLRIWTAACSTGEEAYSLAITVAQSIKLTDWDVKILATDLDTTVLKKADNGIYDADKCKSVSGEICSKYFLKGYGSNLDLIRVKPELQEFIHFKQLNLMDSWPVRGPFDVIMCRNVFIYFDRPTQKQLLSRFIRVLKPGGLLFLGHSESIGKEIPELEVMGHTIYQRKP